MSHPIDPRTTGEEVPPGFVISERSSPLLDVLGPLYTAGDDTGIVLGLRCQEQHLNNRGFVHAAVICLLADLSLGRNCAQAANGELALVTASLTVDLVGRAASGDWLEATATVTRRGRRLCFAQGLITSQEQPIAQCSAVFAVASQPERALEGASDAGS